VKIFVSYSRRDAGDFAKQIYEHLRDEHDVFIDANSIQAGSVWSNEIKNNISNCDLFVAIITHAALRSPEIETEVLQAQRENKLIIPCFHTYVRKNEVKWNLSKVQGIDEFEERHELARKLYSKIIKSQKKDIKGDSERNLNNPQAWVDKGILLRDEGRHNEAIICFDKAIEIKPNHVGAWNSKAFALHNLGRHNEAIICFDKAIEINPHYAYPWNGKGVSLNLLGRYNEAIICYDKAIEIEPNYVDAWNNKGIALHNLGRYNEAIICYDKAIEIKPNHVGAWNSKAFALQKLGRFYEATECYDKAIEIDPTLQQKAFKSAV
jgi:tetratricopeptide (TPR) repeat protein